MYHRTFTSLFDASDIIDAAVKAESEAIQSKQTIIDALILARDTFANLTSEQFARGEDKPARDAIDAALKAAGVDIE